jgi:hypothetical protein
MGVGGVRGLLNTLRCGQTEQKAIGRRRMSSISWGNYWISPIPHAGISAHDGRWQQRTPAMAAGLADHAWSLDEWITFPAVQYN